MRNPGRRVSIRMNRYTCADPRASSFDLDLPADCDDEFWENDDPALAFKQPPRKPSKIAFLISLIKLTQIHASSLRTIVSVICN
jgi:hypothetical protein